MKILILVLVNLVLVFNSCSQPDSSKVVDKQVEEEKVIVRCRMMLVQDSIFQVSLKLAHAHAMSAKGRNKEFINKWTPIKETLEQELKILQSSPDRAEQCVSSFTLDTSDKKLIEQYLAYGDRNYNPVPHAENLYGFPLEDGTYRIKKNGKVIILNAEEHKAYQAERINAQIELFNYRELQRSKILSEISDLNYSDLSIMDRLLIDQQLRSVLDNNYNFDIIKQSDNEYQRLYKLTLD